MIIIPEINGIKIYCRCNTPGYDYLKNDYVPSLGMEVCHGFPFPPTGGQYKANSLCENCDSPACVHVDDLPKLKAMFKRPAKRIKKKTFFEEPK